MISILVSRMPKHMQQRTGSSAWPWPWSRGSCCCCRSPGSCA
jgi:hypothetical protein